MPNLQARSLAVFISIFYFTSSLSGQTIEYTFDGCSLQDETAVLSPMTPTMTEECRCGVDGDGIYTDGIDLYYEMDPSFKDFFEEETYTLRFSFLAQDITEEQALFSLMKDCSRDSMLAVQYIPQTNEVELLISNKLGDSWTTRGKMRLRFTFVI